MGKSKDLASGAAYQDQTETDARYHTKTASDAAFAAKTGDTFTGAVNFNGGNLSVNSTSEAAHRYLFLNTGAANDGHIIFQRAGSNKYQIASDTSNNLFTWNYTKNGTSFRINADGSVITPHQPSVSGRGIRPVYGSAYATTGVNLYLADLTHNNGNNFNNSTGVWTCPVAGRYWCYAAFLIDDDQAAGSLARFAFLRNGTEFFVSYNHDKYGSSYGGTHTTGGIFNCAANDTITCKVTHGKFHTGAESSFSICLLG